MKWIIVIIKLFKLDEVCEVLVEVGVQGMMVIEVKGFGCQYGYIELYWGVEYVVDFLFKLKIEIVVSDVQVDYVIEVISFIVCIGKVGDGKIMVFDLEQVICICMQEVDVDVF